MSYDRSKVFADPAHDLSPMPDLTPWTPPPDDAPLDEAARVWWLRLISKAATTDDVRTLRVWLDADPAHEKAFARARAVWRAVGGLEDVFASAEARDEARQPPRRPSRPARRWIAAGAAGLAVMAALLIFGPDPRDLGADLKTDKGAVREATLPDGTVVWLDTRSALKLDYSAGARRVRLLHGQAWFAVRHDAARPFQVQARGATVTDVGTAFGVRLDAGRTRVSVARGVVRLDRGGVDQTLRAGEAVSLGAGDEAVIRRDAFDADADQAWTGGRLVFMGRPLGVVIGELNRYGPDRILLFDAAAAARPVSAILRLDARPAGLEALAANQHLRLTRLPGLTLLTPAS